MEKKPGGEVLTLIVKIWKPGGEVKVVYVNIDSKDRKNPYFFL